MSNKLIAFLLGLIFFIVGLATLPHYGINWDTINHLPRGQAYLHFFLTGKHDYSDLPASVKDWVAAGKWYWQKENTLFFQPDQPKEKVQRLSLYQAAGVDFNYFTQKDGGHPPLSDILSSFFNYVLFQKLGLVNDIDAYRVYGIFLAAALVGLVYWWVSKIYGKFAGLISSIALSTYPLFWSESHFNSEKDIPEAVYWSFFLFTVWQGISKKSWKWILASGVLFGLALGTKFNILFAALVIVLWLLFTASKVIKQKWLIFSGLAAALIGLTIFVGSWPYLWADPIARIQNVVGFYKGIGLTETLDPRFIGPLGINTYPLLAILYTTPLLILGFACLGLVRFIKKESKERNDFKLLVALWLIIPIGRVVWPGTTIYGGLRQIMEYIPALAILAGIGASFIVEQKFVIYKYGLLIVTCALLFVPLYKIHPNENVYFNSLIGGLAGARQKDFPFWGNSFGAAYRQGVAWLNEHAESGAHIVFADELLPNIPRIWLRSDLDLHNSYRSGYLRQGEYAITLPYQGTEAKSYYDMYLRKFLNPVYEAKVDGVPVVTIWKNDDQHLKVPVIEKVNYQTRLVESEGVLLFDLGTVHSLSRLEIRYGQYGCQELDQGHVQISENGDTWSELPGTLPRDWLVSILGRQPKDGNFIYPFVGQAARFIKINVTPDNTCLKKVQNYKVFYYETQ